MRHDAIFERPTRLDAALGLVAGRAFLPLGGGTDLYPASAAQSLAGPLIDLSRVEELRGIEETGAGIRIGAMTSWTDIARADLPPALDALRQAAREVGGRQIQNAGTIGGNLCNASPAADGMPPLLAVDARVELASHQGRRQLPLAAFVTGPRQTARRSDELLTGIWIPRAALAGRSAFLKLGARRYLVISIASAAVRLVAAAGRVETAAVAVGAASPVARRLDAVEAALLGAPLAEASARVQADAVAAGLAPLDDVRASAGYRATVAAELIRRAVAHLAEATDG